MLSVLVDKQYSETILISMLLIFFLRDKFSL